MVDPEVAGGNCAIDADCDAGDFCSFSGYPVGITVTAGPNIGAGNSTFKKTDVLGQVAFTYKDLGGAGIDTIEGCLDTGHDEPPFPIFDDATVTDCIASAFGEDVASNVLTKYWIPTVVLTPPGAFNLTGTSHTVTATINGEASCAGGVKAGKTCLHDADCPSSTCSDKSGIQVGFKVVSGPNGPLESAAPVFRSTDSNGQATFTYADTNGAGTDKIQACADFNKDGDGTVFMCLDDAINNNGGDGPFDDVASNLATKKWGAINATLTPARIQSDRTASYCHRHGSRTHEALLKRFFGDLHHRRAMRSWHLQPRRVPGIFCSSRNLHRRKQWRRNLHGQCAVRQQRLYGRT